MFGDFWRAGCVPAPSSVSRAHGRAALLLAGVVLLTGCRLDLAAEADVAATGGGTVSMAAGFDAELLDRLDELGVDPTAELEAAATSVPGWETSRRTREDGGLEVTVTRAVDQLGDIGDAFRELSAGLTEADPALLIDIELTPTDDGGTEVTGRAAFRPPASAGISLDGVEVGPDGQELAALVADAVNAQLRIRFPGTVEVHDGDRLEARTVSWELTDDEVSVAARSARPSWWAPLAGWWDAQPAVVAIAGGALVVVLIGAGAFSGRLLVKREA
jgi:hypothetical protein